MISMLATEYKLQLAVDHLTIAQLSLRRAILLPAGALLML
jgi:hypothetical protein